MLLVKKYEDRPESISKVELNPPLWLKVERNRRRLSASTSKDGKAWNTISHYEKEIPQTMFAGLAVSSGDSSKTARAYFDSFNTKCLKTRQLKTRIILTSGTQIDCDILSADTSAFRVYTAFAPDLIITTRNIGYVLFDGTKSDELSIPAGRRGALMSNNDFFEAEFKSIDGDTVMLSSVIFGIRYYKAGDSVKALVFNKPEINSKGIEVILADDTKLICKNIALLNQTIIVQELATDNKFELPVKMMASIKRLKSE